MTLEWTEWIKPQDTSNTQFPGSTYVNWWISRPPFEPERARDGDKLVRPIDLGMQALSERASNKNNKLLLRTRKSQSVSPPLRASDSTKFEAEFPIKYVPIRESSLNLPLWEEIAAQHPVSSPPKGLPLQAQPTGVKAPQLDRNSVIVGVVDRGVPLNHSRLCNEAGTRILASWQIDADWDVAKQAYLPFGREVYKADIDEAICSASTDEAFFEKLGLVDLQSRNRSNDIMYRQSHGAAVLDLAAGAAPGTAPENIWVIVVNLPSRSTIGPSGGFLDYFTTLAAERLRLLSDWIWLANFPDEPIGEGGGFPIVMNLSFGKNAGPQSSDDFFHHTIADIRKNRSPHAPFIPVIAAGNDNLEEGRAKRRVPPHKKDPIYQGWWIQPEDQSPSFLEVWSEPIADEELEKGFIAEGEFLPFTFDVFPPGFDTAQFADVSPKVHSFRVLNHGAMKPQNPSILFGEAPFSAVTVRKFSEPGASGFSRLQFTVCVLPTIDHARPGEVVPSGEWLIAIKNLTSAEVTFDFMVQTDQTNGRSTRTSQRSWLTDPAYQRYDKTGRIVDSYAYPELKSTDPVHAIVRRHGTLNSTAVGDGFISVAGHRELDGRPSAYSSTGARNAENKHVPDVSFPIEDGAAHPGVLTAGSKNGSVLPIGGTSMAAAMATQRLSLNLSRLKSNSSGDIMKFDPEQWFRATAQHEDPYDVSALARPKLGWGRVKVAKVPSRVTRLKTTRQSWPKPNEREG